MIAILLLDWLTLCFGQLFGLVKNDACLLDCLCYFEVPFFYIKTCLRFFIEYAFWRGRLNTRVE